MSYQKYQELKSLVNSLEYEAQKFNAKKIKASGARVRNGLLGVKKLADALRKDIQAELREMPTRSRPVSIPKPTALQRQVSMPPLTEAPPEQ